MQETDPTIRKVREMMARSFEKRGDVAYAARLRRMEQENPQSPEANAILGAVAAVVGLVLSGELPLNWGALPATEKEPWEERCSCLSDSALDAYEPGGPSSGCPLPPPCKLHPNGKPPIYDPRRSGPIKD